MSDRPQLFGTDGVRGVAGSHPLGRETIWRLGHALGVVLRRSSPTPRVALGEDTRESSGWISRTFAAGLRSAGTVPIYAGVMTTPGVAFLTRHHRLDAGVVVSASHNPYQDNGIKIFSPSGTKLPESLEVDIEHELGAAPHPGSGNFPDLQAQPGLLDGYLKYLTSLLPRIPLKRPYQVVVDCAHGAASRVIPELVKRVGIEARILYAAPNGQNINLGCGSLHPEGMAEATRASGADFGVAFDGDADRAIFSTSEGRIADGDHVLFAYASSLDERRPLKARAVVGTLMTNFGLELALGRRGIALIRAAVGDKYVLEEMLRTGASLGGEPSGHIIFADVSLAGDGIITMLQVLRLMEETGQPLAELFRGFEQFPQAVRNVRVREKPPLESIPQVVEAIEECQRKLGEKGRVVVRYSGTEPLARVMVEAAEAQAVERHAARIAAAIDSVLGPGQERGWEAPHK